MPKIRLGLNIDHVATLRNARGGTHPDPVRAAEIAQRAGADVITAHLREDRRHIRDEDIYRLKKEIPLPLNMEMAATEEMIEIAFKIKPHAVCIVPERREELTTEGGLDVVGKRSTLKPVVKRLSEAGMRVSLFIAPAKDQVEASKEIGAAVVELHTGSYAHNPVKAELKKLQQAALLTEQISLECYAGHGLNYENVAPIAAIPQIRELNIGHFLMGEAVFWGLEQAITEMRRLMDLARS